MESFVKAFTHTVNLIFTEDVKNHHQKFLWLLLKPRKTLVKFLNLDLKAMLPNFLKAFWQARDVE